MSGPVPVVLLPVAGPGAASTLLAARLRTAGHRVLLLDVPPGTGALARQQHVTRVAPALPPGCALVASGAACAAAQFLGLHLDPPPSAVVLVGGARPQVELGLEAWPAAVPVQLHAPLDDAALAFAGEARSGGCPVEVVEPRDEQDRVAAVARFLTAR